MKPVFIYGLNDPTTGAMRYIGQTPNPDRRLKAHLNDTQKLRCHRACWIRSLLSKNLRPVMEILDVVPDNEADFWEMEYIQVHKELAVDLTNATPGGSSPPVRRGWHHTPERKAAMSAAISGEKHPDFGKKYSPERIEKTRLFNLGRKATPDAIAKRTATTRNKKLSTNTSGFVGVHWCKARKKWTTHVTQNEKLLFSGRFSRIEDAVFARALAMDSHNK